MRSTADAARTVSIVITHYRAPEELASCLKSLRLLPYADALEVVVADSAAADGTQTLVQREFPGARYFPFAANCGYAALVNAGFAVTERPHVLVLNADIELGADAIPGLVRHLVDHQDVGMVGPAVTHPDGEHQDTAFAFYRPSTIVFRRTPLGRTRRGRAELQRFTSTEETARARKSGTACEVDWLMGAVVMVRRSAVLDTGPINESYFLYFEDVDWCLQFWRSGWRVEQLPTVSCIHHWSRASARGGIAAIVTNPLARRHILSSIRFFNRNGRRVSRPAVAADPTARRAGPAFGLSVIPAQRSAFDSGERATTRVDESTVGTQNHPLASATSIEVAS